MILSRILRCALGLVVCATLAACAQTGIQKDLDQPLSTSQLGLGNGQSTAVSAQWWMLLNQPVLNQLMTHALAHAPDVRQAQARLRQAQAQWDGATGQAGVYVDAQLGGSGMYLSPKPDTSKVHEHSSHTMAQATAHVGFAYTFDFWGRQQNTIQAALGRRQAAQYQLADAQRILAYTMVAQYTQWQLSHAQAHNLAQRVAISQAQEQLLMRRIEAGLLPGSALYAQQLNTLQLQTAQQQKVAESLRLRNSLASLSGQAPATLSAVTPPPLGSTPPLVLSDLKADLLGKRPDIAAQRAVLQSHRHSVAAAQAAFYPNIELRGLAGLAYVDAFSLVRGDSRLLGLMPAITLPIFTSGSLQANLANQHAQYDEQVAVYDQTVVRALQQAANAVSDYQHSQSILALQQKAHELAQKRTHASARRMRAGLDNGITRLGQEDALLLAESSHWQALAEHQQSWNQVNAALGGGLLADQAEPMPTP